MNINQSLSIALRCCLCLPSYLALPKSQNMINAFSLISRSPTNCISILGGGAAAAAATAAGSYFFSPAPDSPLPIICGQPLIIRVAVQSSAGLKMKWSASFATNTKPKTHQTIHTCHHRSSFQTVVTWAAMCTANKVALCRYHIVHTVAVNQIHPADRVFVISSAKAMRGVNMLMIQRCVRRR